MGGRRHYCRRIIDPKKNTLGSRILGFSISLPCAQHRQDGADWDIVLKSDLEYLSAHLGASPQYTERK